MNSNKPDPPGSTSTSLIMQLKNPVRDEAAWQRLVMLYGGLVRTWCRQNNITTNDWVDVAQDVFITVNRSIDSFQWGEPGQTFRGWLKKITFSRATDKHRMNRTLPKLFTDTHLEELIDRLATKPPDETEELSCISDEQEQLILLRRAMDIIRNDFEPQTWEAFHQMEVGGLTSSQVAEMLGTNSANVRRAKKRVLDRLRDVFEGLLD